MSSEFNDPDLLAEFASESLELLQQAESQLVSCEACNDHQERRQLLDAIFRSLHSIKGNSSFFNLDGIQRLSHQSEFLLDDLRHDRIRLSQHCISALLGSVEILKRAIGQIRKGAPSDEAELVAQGLLIAKIRDESDVQLAQQDGIIRELKAALGDMQPKHQALVQELLKACFWEKENEATSPPASTPTTPTSSSKNQDTESQSLTESAPGPIAKQGERRVMRIDEERIDAFLSYVGELVVIGDMFNHFHRQLLNTGIDQELRQGLGQVVGTFQALSSKLQHAIMSVRTVPARQLLRKAPKLARDIALALDKDIRVDIQGEDREIDKGYVDLLDAPLVHMVRNAADHGIEKPDEREALGKPRQGRIFISVSHDQESVILEISDDGRGINLQRIAQRAKELGILAEGQELDHGALIDCIFAAGVSTAETVSDISGRGVGMDVVKRAIQQAGGKITIDTTAGKGSLFRIALPKSVTTQIGMGYFVRSGGELFILDLEAVQETFHQVKAPQHTPEQVSFIQRRGRTLPVINLSHQLGLRTSQTAAIAIATEVNNRDCALLVEEVVGIKQMVKLPLDLPGQHHLPYQGVAMQGNGQLALILDLARLCQAAHQDH